MRIRQSKSTGYESPQLYSNMKLVENLTTFSENTSLHGLKFIGKRTSTANIRLTWLFLFFGSLFYAIMMISYEAKGKILVDIQVVTKKMPPFPKKWL